MATMNTLRYWWRRLLQRRCLHAWTPDPPGWKCMWCDAVEAAGTFPINYEGEGQG